MILRTLQLIVAVLGLALLFYSFGEDGSAQGKLAHSIGMICVASGFFIFSYVQFLDGRKND
jgi:hypothetical protein